MSDRVTPARIRRARRTFGLCPPDAVTGIRARIVVPAPTGLSISSVPPSALTRSASPLSPEPRAGSTPPLPSSRTSSVACPSPTATRTSIRSEWACLEAFVSASATTKYAVVCTDNGSVPQLSRSSSTGTVERPASGGKRGLEAAIGEDAGMDPASELAELLECGVELGARDRELARRRGVRLETRLETPEAQRQRDEPLLGAVVKVALDPSARRVRGLDDPRSRGGQLLTRIHVRERRGDELGEAADPRLGARRERVRQLAGHHDRAPEATGHVDRSSDDRADPELAQPRRELALDAGVVVHALRAPASVELRGHRLALDRDALADRERRRVAPRPGADHRREALVLEADHVGALHREQLPELFADPAEEGRRGRAAGDHRRDSAQRSLFGEERLEPGEVRRRRSSETEARPRERPYRSS